MPSKRTAYADNLRARILRHPSGLRAEHELGEFDVVATYEADDGTRVFDFCLEGLLFDPEGDARFIPFAEISATDYYDLDKLKNEKRAQPLRWMTLRLLNGETIDLPLNERPDGMSERLAIGGLIEQRIRLTQGSKI